MAKRHKRSHVQLLGRKTGDPPTPSSDYGVLSDEEIDSICEQIIADAGTNRRPFSRVHAFTPVFEHQTEDIWLFVAQDKTPIKTAARDMTLHEFLDGIRAGDELNGIVTK